MVGASQPKHTLKIINVSKLAIYLGMKQQLYKILYLYFISGLSFKQTLYALLFPAPLIQVTKTVQLNWLSRVQASS